MTQSDIAACCEHGIRIVPFNSRGTQLRDRIQSGIHRLRCRFQRSVNAEPVPVQDIPLTLEHYRWPLATMQFRSLVDSLHPDIVFSVYLIWSHLLDAYPERSRSFQAVVDTHDLLHFRQLEFIRHGQSHWIDISREEEAAALRKFDLILATQQEEAKLIQELAPERDVIVVGHHPESGPLVPRDGPVSEQQERALRFGFIASNNAANVDGLGWFLTEC